jgi:hypothetical protein
MTILNSHFMVLYMRRKSYIGTTWCPLGQGKRISASDGRGSVTKFGACMATKSVTEPQAMMHDGSFTLSVFKMQKALKVVNDCLQLEYGRANRKSYIIGIIWCLLGQGKRLFAGDGREVAVEHMLYDIFCVQHAKGLQSCYMTACDWDHGRVISIQVNLWELIFPFPFLNSDAQCGYCV